MSCIGVYELHLVIVLKEQGIDYLGDHEMGSFILYISWYFIRYIPFTFL